MTPADWAHVGMLAALGALFMLPAVALWWNHREQRREAERAARQKAADLAAREHLRKWNATHAERIVRERDQRAGRPLPRPTAPAPTPANHMASDVTHWPIDARSPTIIHATGDRDFLRDDTGNRRFWAIDPTTSGGGGNFAGAGASGDWRCNDASPPSSSDTSSSDSCSTSTTGSD